MPITLPMPRTGRLRIVQACVMPVLVDTFAAAH